MSNLFAFNAEQEHRFLSLCAYFDQYGFICHAEPIEGMEKAFLASLEKAASEIDETANFVRSRYGTRGASKRTIELIHQFRQQAGNGLVRSAAK